MSVPQLVDLARHRPAGLDGLVAGVVGLRERAAEPVHRRQPAGSLTLVRLSLGGGLDITELSGGEGAGRARRSFVVGFMPGYADTHFSGELESLQIYLTPRGVARILGLPAGELGRQVVDLADVAPQLSGTLLDRLAATADWSGRFALLDETLRELAARGREQDPVAELLWRDIQQSAGRVRVAQLVRSAGWSHRRTIQRLREHVGVSPKTAASVVRFEHAVHELNPASDLADVAARRGYADQSHLSRDVLRHAGTTPAALRKAPVPTPWLALGRGPGLV